MPNAPSPARQAASRANGARSRGPVTEAGKTKAARNGLRGGAFCLLPGEDAEEMDLLRQAVATDWHPRDAYERHWAGELVAALWRQRRLRRLEFAALDTAGQEHPPSEASLKRLLTFARYGARIDKDMSAALRALRVLRDRPDRLIAETTDCTSEPGPSAPSSPQHPTVSAPPAPHGAACTGEPKPPAGIEPADPSSPHTPEPADPRPPLNRHQRRRLEALARRAGLIAA